MATTRRRKLNDAELAATARRRVKAERRAARRPTPRPFALLAEWEELQEAYQ